MLKSCLERLQQEAGRAKDVKEAVSKALEDWEAEKEEIVAAGGDPEAIRLVGKEQLHRGI